MKFFGYTVLLTLVLALSYGGWLLERNLNFEYDYSKRVEDRIKKMVKSECLRE